MMKHACGAHLAVKINRLFLHNQVVVESAHLLAHSAIKTLKSTQVLPNEYLLTLRATTCTHSALPLTLRFTHRHPSTTITHLLSEQDCIRKTLTKLLLHHLRSFCRRTRLKRSLPCTAWLN